MKEDWIENIRGRLDGHQMKEPDGLWEDIRNAIGDGMDATGHDNKPKKRNRAALIPMWIRTAAVAAIAAVAVITIYRGLSHDNGKEVADIKENVRKVSPNTGGAYASQQLVPVEKPSASAIPDYTRTAFTQPHIIYNIETGTTEQANGYEIGNAQAGTDKENSEVHDENIAENVPDNADTREKDAPSEKQTGTNVETKTDKPTEHKQYRNLYESEYNRQIAGHREAHGKGVEIGVTVANGLMAYNGTTAAATRNSASPVYGDPIPPGDYYLDIPECMKYNGMTFASMLRDEEVHHDVPVKFGLSIRYAISNRWAIESGANYSRLRSTFSSGDRDNYRHTVQRLNYVSIPVSLIYTIWNKGGLSVYAAGGGEVAKCVSGNSGTETVLNGVRADESSNRQETDHPWQLSVNGAIGIQYSFVRNLSLYAEPSLGYYFKNGSSLDTYYSKHQLSPGIRIGLRLQIR